MKFDVPIQELVAPAFLTTSVAVVYASPFAAGAKGVQTWVSTIWMANVTGVDRLVSLYLVPNGGSASGSNKLLGDLVIKANTSTLPPPYFIQTADGQMPLKIISAGASLYAVCDANSAVTFCMDGAEISG